MDETLLSLSLEEKISKSKEVIREALEKYERTAVAWTGGKDSTLMLWLVKEVCKEDGYRMPPALFINEGDVFKEVLDFVRKVAKEWNLDVVEVKNEDVLKQVTKLGDIVKVEKLNEITKHELKRLGFSGSEFHFEPESFVGNHLMKTLPLNNFIAASAVQAILIGIRWDEQEARREELYFSPRSEPKHVRVHPILHFRERDVWGASKKYSIPHNELYTRGYRSLGAKTTTTKVGNVPAWEQDLESIPERSGRAQDKEGIMKRLRDLGYM